MTNPQPLPSTQFRLPSALLHDLRTPINHIIGYSELLIEQAYEGPPNGSLSDLEKVRHAGHGLLSLINRSFISERNFEPMIGMTETATLDGSTPLADASTPEDRGRSEGCLLVVDDDEGNRDVLSRQLERFGYRVETANDGLQALDKLTQGDYDLVLLDIMMPEIDGYEALRRLKADDRLQHIPVVMISALNELELVARCIELGAEDYLPKPFNPTLLKARVSACLQKKRAHDRETALYDELQMNYKRLQELEKLRDDLTNMIVHDLRTPLSSLITGMQTLELLGSLNKNQQEVQTIALSGGEVLLDMINDLLDVEKLESGEMQLDYDMVAIEDLVAAAIGQVGSLLSSKQLRIVEAVTPGLPTLLADERKLRRTLVNLLGNAIKFTPSQGTLTVGAKLNADGQSVELSVNDTGEGIPAESFERIFEKFGQVETRQGGRTMSTGLGLTFCRLAVEAHGGHIKVESESGVGSTFSFTIPVPAAAA
jgi:signal transduction histidine kinase